MLRALRLGLPLGVGSAGALTEAALFLVIVGLLGQHMVGVNVGKLGVSRRRGMEGLHLVGCSR